MSDLARDKVEEKQFIPPEHWKCLDVAEIDDWECPETEWIIQDIIAKGTFNLVAAASQTGKSLLWLYICSKLLPDSLCGLLRFGRGILLLIGGRIW